ncbi:hypothetical protein M8C21_017700, partial [Ambrosia artemisiifolia]
ASGFSASSTAEEVTEGIDGSGLTAIVTGATSGIGYETARVLAMRGVHVIMAVRNIVKATQVNQTIFKDAPDAKIDVMELDLSSMASLRDFAAKYRSSGLPLHILINNAGVLSPQFKLSKENIELHFATNHLGEEGVNITANSLHPGFVDTDIFRGHRIFSVICNKILSYFIKDISQGAATTCYLALNTQVKGVTGEYFSDSNSKKPSARANDQELAKELWEFSMGLTSSK